MEKSASSRALYHCLSLAELVGFLVLESILIWVNKLHKLSLGLLTTYNSSRNYRTGECMNMSSEAEEDGQEIRREDVEMVMERIGIPIGCAEFNCDDVSTVFEEKVPSLEEVKEAFSVFDENSDGFIDAAELQRVLLKLLGFREGADLNACQKMIDAHDENQDGKIDFNEFVRFMESGFC